MRTSKPNFLKVIWASIPKELQAYKQWVCWCAEWVAGAKGKPGRWTKVPHQTNGRRADKTNPAHWSDFSEVVAAFERSESGFDGIGFVLTENDPFTAIDLDHCVSGDGVIDDQARATIEALNSYTEYSPSGHGIRIFVKGQLARNRRKDKAEVYGKDWYVTVTGHTIREVAA